MMNRRMTRREWIRTGGAGLAGGAALLAGLRPLEGRKMTNHRTDWMTRGSFGMMVHWIAPGPAPEKGEWIRDLNRAVDGFDVAGFLDQFRQSGASWLIFTIGQNSTYYASPNATLDGWAGPGHTSRRDLALEIARGVHKQGKRFIGYLPAEVNAPEPLHNAFRWNPADQTEFQHRYTAFIREYSERYGKHLSGWWFDGCYTWPEFPNRLYDWPLWCDAARAGNPNAVVAFNDGSFCTGNTKPLTPLQDYLSGEVETLQDGKIRLGRGKDAPLYLPTSRWVDACQWHALVPIDCFWAHETPGPMEPPRYPDAELFSFVKSCKAVGGAVTLNVGIYQEGHIGPATLAQLERLSEALKGTQSRQ
ncbi:MAG: hypothetical protein M3Y56_11675 [Armatimonadota bacterium]|nr:hypothetical protein [Armatimonadota bacterium]